MRVYFPKGPGMGMTRKFLDDAYSHDEGEAARRFYDEWAATYNEEVADNGYVTPTRCAEALKSLLEPPTAAILDLGCGTGLSGVALRRAGFTAIDGWDPSAEMLRRAEALHVYRVLRHIDPTKPLDAPAGVYKAVNAAGVMHPGLAPPKAIDQILGFLASGGLFCFSLNDHAIEDGAHLAHVEAIIERGAATLRFKEYGEHLPKRDLKSWVYVIEKP